MSLENFPTHFYYTTTTPFSTTYEDMFDQLNNIISTKTTSYMVKLFSNNTMNNFTNSNSNNSMERIPTTTNTSSSDGVFESKIIIPLYVIIFVLAIVGNTLVLVTLMRNKRMRTVTNVYLLNLAVSDLLLGVFCMPFTLVGQVLRNFIFGLTMCKLIPYFQAVSVSVGVWTLVAISLERYFAICRPLKSRRWQTQFHAYKMIAVVWLASLFWSGPVLVVSSLRAMKRGHKCREDWPSRESEQIFNLFLDVMLLLIPMIIMSMAYSLIMTKLWKGLQREIEHNSTCRQQGNTVATSPSIRSAHLPLLPCSAKIITTSTNSSTTTTTTTTTTTITNSVAKPIKSSVINEKNHKKKDDKKKGRDKTDTVKMWLMKGFVQVRLTNAKSTFHNQTTTATTTPTSTPQQLIYTNGHFNTNPNNLLCNGNNDPKQEETNQDDYTTTYTFSRHAIRSNYMDKSIEAKKKVIRMLFVIVAEFFICWAPLHILNTWYLFYPQDVYKYVGSTGVALVQLLAYFSSCCNPITYCFMNRKFRQAFLTVFNCYSYCLCIPKESRSDNPRYIRNGLLKVAPNHSDASCNDSTVYVGRASTLGRSEVVVLEAEDRV